MPENAAVVLSLDAVSEVMMPVASLSFSLISLEVPERVDTLSIMSLMLPRMLRILCEESSISRACSAAPVVISPTVVLISPATSLVLFALSSRSAPDSASTLVTSLSFTIVPSRLSMNPLRLRENSANSSLPLSSALTDTLPSAICPRASSKEFTLLVMLRLTIITMTARIATDTTSTARIIAETLFLTASMLAVAAL